jgi:DNA modification methylase
MELVTDPGFVVLDPFLGSGTTLVACENLGRKGRGIEIAPQYVAVILERLAGLGLTPVRLS